MEHQIKLTEEQRTLIERIGVAHEQEGMQPAAGRILALLMVAPEVALSFEQIYETLGISKSAASNAINMLLNVGRLEYITKPGDRKRYFRNRMLSWETKIKHGFESMKHFGNLMEEVLATRPKDTVEFNSKLKEIIDFIRFMEKKLPILYKEWDEKRKK